MTPATQADEIEALRRAASRLYQRRPCRGRASCLARERERLAPEERVKFPAWECRPYHAYDVLRLCDACLAFWHAENAARIHEAQRAAEDDGRPLPQKG